MVAASSPAGRLHEILTRARAKYQHGSSQRRVWAGAFEIEETETKSILRKIALLVELIDIVERKIRNIPDIDHELYLEWQPEVEKAFSSIALDREWGRDGHHITDATLRGLRICHDLLNRRDPEPAISGEQIASLRDEIHKLHADVLSADLSDEIRAYILKQLDMIDRALVDFMITGPSYLSDVVARTIGNICLDQARLYKQSQQSEVGARLWEILGRIANVVGAVEGIKNLSGFVSRWLP